jgi:hypothetical protein
MRGNSLRGTVMMTRSVACLCALLLSVGACGDDSDSGGSQEPIATNPVTPGPLNPEDIVSVETLLPVTEMVAGDSVNVTCLANDSEGHQGPVEGFTVVVEPSDGVSVNGMSMQCTLAGELAVACALGELIDDSPAPLVVRAGPAAVSSATVTPSSTKPEEVAVVACEVEDAYGNPVDGVDTTVEVEPPVSISVDGMNVSGTAIGDYEVTCTGTGIESALSATWTLEPGPSVTFGLKTIPETPAHKVNSGIQVIGIGEDAWANPVSGLGILDVTATPEDQHTLLGENQTTISFATEGFYTLTANWAENPTQSASLDIVVDQTGPTLTITSPERGLAPQGGAPMVTLSGSVSDNLGTISWLTILGETVQVPEEGGDFSVEVPLAYGVNILDVQAADQWGNERTAARSVFWSDDHYTLSPASFDTDAVTKALIVDLGQSLIDDGDHDPDNLNDLATIMEVVMAGIDLSGLVPNPLTTFPCIAGDCEVHATNIVIGSAAVSMQLIEGGIAITLGLVDFSMDIEVHTPAVSIFPAQVLTGIFTVDQITVDMDTLLSMENGELIVDADNVAVDFKNTSILLFDSILPILDDLINQGLDFIEPALLGILETAIPFLVEEEISKALSQFAEAFSLDEEIELPALIEGQAPTVLKLQSKPSQVFPTAKSLRFEMDGLSYAVDGVRPYDVPGSPQFSTCGPPGDIPTPPTGPMVAGVHDDFLNQLAFAIWDSGTLNMSLDGDSLGDLDLASYGVLLNALELDGMLPPMIESCDGVMKLQVGDLFLDADLILLGEAAQFSMWLQVEATINFVSEVDDEGVSKLVFDLQDFDTLFMEVVTNAGMFEGDDAGLVDLIGNTMLPLLLDNLAGDALGIELPAIDVSELSPELPAGTELNIDLQEFGRKDAYLVIDAGLK